MTEGHWSTCIQCSNRMWMPQSHYEAAMAMRGKLSFFCSYGHPQVFKTKENIREEDEIRRERDRLKQSVAQLEDSVRYHVRRKQDVEKQLSAQRGVVTKMRKRASAGVCPCCTRTFTNMAQHMKTKHPEFTAIAAE